MKKASAAAARPQATYAKKERPGWIREHEHIHAANCGHASYVHGDHVCYEHDGHFHFVVEGKTYECPGPGKAQVLPFAKGKAGK